MTAGASVGSIYGQMILDTSQYEAALRQMVGLTSSGGKNMEKSVGDLGKRMDELEGKTNKNKQTVGEFAKAFSALGSVIGAGAIVGGIRSMVMEAGKFETIRTSFNVLMGDVKKGEKILADLNQYSVVTPFTPEQVFQAGKTLLAFNISAQKLLPTMRMLGDVSAGTGKDFGELAVIFGQVSSMGRLQGQDLLQLINAGFNPLQVIAEKTGKSMATLKKEMEAGLISFDMVEQAFKDATSEGGKFYKMTEEQSKTLNGALSTLEGNVQELKKGFGEGLAEVLKPLIVSVSDFIGVVLKFRQDNPNTFKAISLLTMGFAGLVAVLIGGAGLKYAIDLVLPALRSFGLAMNLSLGPIGLVTAAIITLVGLYAKMKDGAINALREIQRESERLAQANGAVSETTKKHFQNMVESIRGARDGGNGIVINATSKSFQNEIEKSTELTVELKNKLKILAESARTGEHSVTALAQAIEALGVAEKKSTKNGGGSGGAKDKLLTIEELISAYLNLDKISSKDIAFSVDFTDFLDAKKAIDELGTEGFSSKVSYKVDNKTGKVVTQVDFIGADGSKITKETLTRVLKPAKPVSVPVEIDAETKGQNIDTGVFEGLKQNAIKSAPEIAKFISEKLGVEIEGDLKGFFDSSSGQWTQGLMATASKGIEVYMAMLNAAANLAQVRLQNQVQNLNFLASYGSKQIDDNLKAVNGGLDAEVRALEAQKAELLRIEDEYQAALDERRQSEIEKIKARIEAEYQAQAAALQLRYEADVQNQYDTLNNQDVAYANESVLTEDHLTQLNDLRQRFNDQEASDIEALNRNLAAESEAKKKDRVTSEKSIVDQLAAIEAQKVANQEAADKKKKDLERDNARLQWVLGMNAFNLQKQAAIMQAKVQTAMMVIDITRAAFSMIPFTLPLLGFLPMAYQAGTMAIAAASMTQYPPPPAAAFATGGIVTGGERGKDSVPAMLMPGELVVPTKNFDEVVSSVSSNRNSMQGTTVNITGDMYFYEVMDAEGMAEQVKPILLREIRAAVEAI